MSKQIKKTENTLRKANLKPEER